MRPLILFLCLYFIIIQNSLAQENAEIERAALDYIEGFYEGDTTKIKRSIHPDLSKYGYSRDNKTKKYKGHPMSYDRAIAFAREVSDNSKWAAPKDAVKKIEILDAQDKIASVKLTLYWGIDYVLMAKIDNKWMITKVLWQAVDE
ncbi:nuclear transport factor 2 family protein [Aquimarina sp. 2201CG5-10]|uniref:nuclear transport factor 2 family protein n=1 Tax=Aquimarina callyspongiae TaxID=3098150 RepID=UPI002AB4C87C|nr:nuclear transport factor 2 family protein [Aquimarina sp. 2201CG5-10]MDY8135513.1 nuclear transport factor 2 family protein [Aquimarina sp. 2201CG5-10]